MYHLRQIFGTLVLLIVGMLSPGSSRAEEPRSPGPNPRNELAVIKRDVQTGFSNAGWKYDRYKDLPSLDAGKSMTVADLTGPGIIRHIHTTRHHDPDLTARGIVIEIYFDDAPQPAVCCPLADFFGDGCNGKSMYFSTPLIECAPWSYNCYIPMPFSKRAKVILRNDTDKDTMNYSYVEWEPLSEWNESLGYFHATWLRRVFQLSKETEVEFFHVTGAGQVVGRQLSVVTDEPYFRDFHVVMEGNNEVDIDGRPRALDYLGTEDSFTFSWGFQKTFAGLHAGMPFLATGSPAMLSIYRFHDHQPIRFCRELSWSINWREETFFTAQPEWAHRVEAGGCWVHYDSVYYWYQDDPAGYEHEPLPPVAQRRVVMAHPNASSVDVEQLLKSTRLDSELANRFDSAADIQRVGLTGCYLGTHPFWIDTPEARGGHPGNPNPGRRGILAVHAQGETVPALVVRKVALPEGAPSALRLVVSGDPYEAPDKSDFLLDAGIHDGQQMHWFPTEVVEAGSGPSAENWKTFTYRLDRYAGQTVGIVVKISYGGPQGVMNEEAFFDEISVVPVE